MSSESDISENTQNNRQMQLVQENNRLRKKLKSLNERLNDELEKVGKMKLKLDINPVKLGSPESQSLQLQNAYKMIERLQKTVKDFQNKQAYQVSFKRILDLENIIKKKDTEIEELKGEQKISKKTLREKDKHIKDLLQRQAVNPNLNQEKQMIAQLKEKIKKITKDREDLKKKEMAKHEKLVLAERRIIQLEQADEQPIGRSQQLLNKLKQSQNKYKDAMQRIEKQNIYITKLNTRLAEKQESIQRNQYKPRNYSVGQLPTKKSVAKSLQQLPELNNSKQKVNYNPILDHIPSPHIPSRLLKRY